MLPKEVNDLAPSSANVYFIKQQTKLRFKVSDAQA